MKRTEQKLYVLVKGQFFTLRYKERIKHHSKLERSAYEKS